MSKATRFFGLGALQEIGKACMVIEHDDEIAIVDAGVKFVNSMESGADGMIPDYSYLAENEDKIVGLYITHGHEDHMGGVPYLLRQVKIKKIFAPRIGIAYLKNKLIDKGVSWDGEFVETQAELVDRHKHLEIDFWTTQHSIPDAFGVRVKTPNGYIMYTGDFRIDYTPIGNKTDFPKLEQIGKDGLDIFLSDSTNSMRPDHSPTEQKIFEDIEKIIKETTGKTIFTTFASNVNRIGVVIPLAKKYNKKVCVFGRSMVNGMKIIEQLKMFDLDPAQIIDKKQIHKYPDNELLILTTGSQGEEMAALNRIAQGKHAQVSLKKGDVVIFSSSPIPGNRMRIEQLVNAIYKTGAEAKEHRIDGILHTSGHAYKDEHLKVFGIVKPKYFIPFHGSYRQSAVHAQTAIESGVKKENNFMLENGEVILLKDHVVTKTDEVIDAGPVYIDGGVISKDNSKTMAVRANMAKNGFINIAVLINKKKNEIVGRTIINTRGAIYTRDAKEFLSKLQTKAHGSILYTIKNTPDWKTEDIKKNVGNTVSKVFYEQKRRYPVIFTSVIYK